MRFIFAVLVVLTGIAVENGRSQPKLEIVGGPILDFGDIWTSSAKKLLTLRNRGTDTLAISNVYASCGCTGTLLSEERIAPGRSGTLEISFDAKRFSGTIEKYVAFQTNDSSQKRVNITFRANVNKSLEFDPEYFYFSVFRDSMESKEIVIKNSSDVPIRILGIAPSSNEITVKSSATEILPGDEVTLTGSILVTSAGTTRGEVVITTDHPHVPRFTITYFALVKEKN